MTAELRSALAPVADALESLGVVYRVGGGMSERQWHDILGVLQVQAADLDRAYLDRWAADLGVSDLLARAFREAEPR